MRIVLDTNVIISALIAPRSLPGAVLWHWVDGRYDLVTCEQHIEELKRVSRYPKLKSLVQSHVVGSVVKDLRKAAEWLEKLPPVDLCRDPMDNYLLAMAQASSADYVVTGDKADLLVMGKHGATRIVSVREFAEVLKI